MKIFNGLRGLALGAGLCLAAPIAAQNVTLTTTDGSTSITGEFVSFDGGIYVIQTTLGPLRLNAGGVDCEGDACPQLEVGEIDATFAGSRVIADGLMPLLIAGYADSLSAISDEVITGDADQVVFSLTADGGYGAELVSFLVVSNTADSGFNGLLSGDANAAISARRIQIEEARALSGDGAGNMVSFQQENVIAVDSLLIIVHESNPINAISISDIGKIYSGEIRNWAELGGPDAEIVVLSYDEGSATRDFFEEHVLAGVSGNDAQWVVQSGEEAVARVVYTNPYAIGYVGNAFQRGAKALKLISSCGLVSIPDAFSAKTEDYSLARRIYAYTRADNTSDQASQLINYALSEAADGVIAKAGFIDLSVARIEQSNAEGRMQQLLLSVDDPFELLLMRDMIVEMSNWDRLSSTFRFGAGSSRLDNKAELDMARLVNYLEAQPSGTVVSTVGFTDSDGAFSGNQNLSERRAEDVLTAIYAHAGTRLDHLRFETQGYGELSPAGCNDNADGKRLNRRVEIWIRNTLG